MRIDQLLNMKWDWINFEQKFITIKNSEQFTTKGKKERIIPINQSVQQVLKSRIPIPFKNDFVFNRVSNVKLSENFISKSFKNSLSAAALNDDIHFHTLRHSFASALVQKGVSFYIVKDLPGHEDLRTSQIYSHLQKENLFRGSVNKSA